ncbi:MAG: energy transducer TonB [Tunicatimonas sp.]
MKYKSVGFVLVTMIVLSISETVHGQDVKLVDSVGNPIDEELDICFGANLSQPEPESGYEAFMNKIKEELTLPDGLTQEGKTFIEFVVDSSGNVTNAKILKGFSGSADKEALRAFTSVKERFKPGIQRGKPVNVKVVLPVMFKLKD